MQAINLSKLLKGFSSGWVAISSDYKKVLASGKSLKQVTEKIKKLNREDVVLLPVAKNYRGFVTSNR